MKKIFLIAAALCGTLGAAQAQNAKSKRTPYVRVGVGYAFAHAGTVLGETYNDPLAGANSVKVRKASFGAGIHAQVAAGMQLNQHIALELGAHIGVAPKKYEVTNTGSGYTSTNVLQSKTNVMIVPAIVLSTGNTRLEPYMRMGLLVPVLWGLNGENDATGGGTSHTETEYKMRMGIGAQGALGLKLNLGSMALYGELGGNALNGYLKSSEVTVATVNGANVMNTYSTRDRETEYEFDYTENSSPNEPKKMETLAIPYSNVQVNVGVLFRF